MDIFEVKGGNRLKGEVEISGAKNSALKIMAASILAGGKTKLKNVPEIEDVKTMIEVLKGLNVKVSTDWEKDTIEIDPGDIDCLEAPYELVRKMRASVLVAGPLLSRFGEVKIAIPGGCNIGARQIDLHLKGFEELGSKNLLEHGYITCVAKDSSTKRLKGNDIELDFPSRGATENLMMAASLAKGKTVIKNAAREAEIADLASYLNKAGAQISGAGTDSITITGQEKLEGAEFDIMPDSIEAGTFLTAGALCSDGLVVKNAIWKNIEVFCNKLIEIGIDIEKIDEATIRISNDGFERLKPVYISTLPFPGFPTDLQPIITVLLSLVGGTSIVTENVFENRFMYVEELNRMGANIKIEDHHAVVNGVKNLSAAPVKAFDLRAGAAMVLAGLVAEGTTEISDVYHIQRGYEDFVSKLLKIGADIKEKDK